MSQPIPWEELKKVEAELQAAVSEYMTSMKLVQQEEEALESELVEAVEEEKIKDVKNKLGV